MTSGNSVWYQTTGQICQEARPLEYKKSCISNKPDIKTIISLMAKGVKSRTLYDISGRDGGGDLQFPETPWSQHMLFNFVLPFLLCELEILL